MRDNYEKCTNILEGGEWINETSKTDDFRLGATENMFWKNLGSDTCKLHYYNWTEAYQCLKTVKNTQKFNILKHMCSGNFVGSSN